jgi:cyclic 2,3-diphosphoglycerate synthase
MRYLVVVDGEHYPPVIEDAIRGLADQGHEILGAVVAGGREKLPSDGRLELAGVPVITGDDAQSALATALDGAAPDAVMDLSDEPVLDYRRRHVLIAVALHRGVAYEGPDFSFAPPPRPRLATRPALAILGTGKRTGKTAVAGFAARTLTAAGIDPVIVAMGRGGPPEPEVLRGDELELSAENLLEMADAGKHAASDYIEDALLGRVPTVGCRRCGGGLAGAVQVTNLAQGVAIANGLPGDLCILEGSGSAIPPAHADAAALVVPAAIPHEYVSGYFGPYRLLLADLIVVTMCEEPFGSSSHVSSLVSRMRETRAAVGRGERKWDEVRVVRTIFRPSPTRSVEGAEVFVATTAPEVVGDSIKRHLEDEHGCRVLGMSHSLSDRSKLHSDLRAGLTGADVLLCEIKAAGIDVATRHALHAGLDVVYMDNVPVGIDGDDPEAATVEVARLAVSRFEAQEDDRDKA